MKNQDVVSLQKPHNCTTTEMKDNELVEISAIELKTCC
jgi:hypothetical protein